jgi:RHS repeat-associated protein
VTDANQHTTSYSYDDNNRLTRIDYPDSTYETFTYYDTGALYTRTDGNGVTTTYTRDELDRVTAIDYPGAASDVTFTYDAEGRVTRMQDGNCDTLYHYDVWGTTEYDQLIQVQRKYGSMTSYRATSYTYDENYNRIGMVDGAGNGTSYTYDANNQLASITRLGTTYFTYDAVGNRTLKTFPNSAYTAYTYNNRNWLTSLENRKADTLISSYAYGHDDVGNRTSMTEANGDVTSYTYDNVYRLTDETKRDSQNNVLYRYQYTYDGVGNRLTETNTGQITYSYDSNNKLTQLVGPGGTTTFGYDNNGNTTSMTQPGPVTTTYGYDYENRLASVTNPSYTAAYTYSPDGLRLRVQESNAQYTDRWLQYDGVRPVLEGTLSGDTFTTVNKYVWEGDSYYDPLAYALVGGSWRYYMYDGLGSTRQLMLHASPYTVTDTYQYEAFGNLMASTGTTPNPYRYVGSLGYYQTGSSLMHLGARYYMPEVGLWVQADPVRYFDTSGVRNYVGNNPLTFVDASGQAEECCDPKKERNEMRGRVRQLRQDLRDRPAGGSYGPGDTADTLPAWTRCDPLPGGGPNPVTHENGDILADPYYTPCIKQCIRSHEWWHRHQCRDKGSVEYNRLYNNNPWNLEDTAYAVEIDCLMKLLGLPH